MILHYFGKGPPLYPALGQINPLHITELCVNFMVTPCLNIIQHFNFQLMHTTLQNVELLKHFRIRKPAPTCFGLQGNHHQGATVNI